LALVGEKFGLAVGSVDTAHIFLFTVLSLSKQTSRLDMADKKRKGKFLPHLFTPFENN